MCGCLSSTTPPLGIWPATQACALDWELNQQPFGSHSGSQCIEPHQPGLSMGLLYMLLDDLSTSFPCYHPISSGYCQFVLYFSVFGYLLLAFFVLLIRFHFW